MTSDKAAGRVLLPSGITPSRYDITLTPDLTNFTFTGVTTIQLQTAADISTSTIQLHAKELCFASASYTILNDDTIHTAEEISTNTKSTVASFTFPTPLPANCKLKSAYFTTIFYVILFLLVE